MPLILTGTSASTTLDSSAGLTFSDSSNQSAAASPFGLKNRIINGDMVVDQRNNGASVTPSALFEQYTLDRWVYTFDTASRMSIQRNAGSVTPPAGFTNYLGATTVSAYSVTSGNFLCITQKIEGFNIADLAWGTANARTVTLSFWVRSSLTGTFGGSLRNSDSNRSYPFSYTISSANTWTQISITIPGDTSGTWATTNGIGLQVHFGLGIGSLYSGTAGSWATANFLSSTGATSVVGTNGATFYITGVQLERNTTATPFEWIPYGQELMLCQRYCYVGTGANCFVGGAAQNANNIYIKYVLPVIMRATPTLSFVASSGNELWMSDQYVADFPAAAPTIISAPNVSDISGRVFIGGFSGLTTGRWYGGAPNTTARSIFSAEL
jgi:hypothetical protein